MDSLESFAEILVAIVQVLIRLVDIDHGCRVRALLNSFVQSEMDSRALALLHLILAIKCT